MEFALVLLLGLVAGTLGGIIGFGTSIMVMPALVLVFGRWMARRQWQLRLRHLALLGAGIGFLTGIVASTGPINAPFFLAYGLVKGAYLGTEAMSSLAVFAAKAITFQSLGALPAETLGKGLITGSSLMAGAFIAKHFVRQLDANRFRLLMDGLLLAAGVTMLWAAAGRAIPLLD